ncbi:MAG: aminotransferase class V-fold PLP-dependent enzyme [Erysipelotrichaceae bacterium]|uniref:aminotransferase class V-fold PLP-dependent enzyme n=1 Tax=Floccifex sp. TaxID=2815810 RepID=UPI002A75C27E|nr:aminotransferase class V-fold PLP-dependent enzyme [Floccifex sp.]MDD7281519.1 aminotransferase class V-fold PLP-dependent enzyme [Erysipelotrichaceae bacterium]MDY2957978.1 aminotransferase class V-fold PLP-dependent enzyme [Floccifex sp.]
MLNRELIEQEYDFLKDEIFLNVSSVVMPPKRVQAKYNSFMNEYIENYGDDIVPKSWQIVEETRKKIAQLIHAQDPLEIGFVKNTCEGVSILADGYPFKQGDNVVLCNQEHQANLFPWINVHQRKGVELKVVHAKDNEINADDLISQIDEHTRILTISSIQFSTGFYADLKKLGQACKEHNVLFMVDGIQALGRFDINVQEMNIDYLAAGTNKGLLGTLGAGFVYCSKQYCEQIIPPYASYQSVVSHVSPPNITTNFDTLEWHHDSRRFESGNLSYNCINAINAGVELILELGIENIESHIKQLEKYLRNQLTDLHIHVVQAKDEKNWGGIVCVYYPENQDEQVMSILKKYKIHCTIRGGYIRFGLEFFNTQEQMDIVSKALHEIDQLGGK